MAGEGVEEPRRAGGGDPSSCPFACLSGRGVEPTPSDLPGQTEFVEPARVVPDHSGGQDVALPLAGGDLDPLELVDHLEQAATTFGLSAGGDVLPAGEEPDEVADRSRVDPLTTPAPARRVEPHQQVARAHQRPSGSAMADPARLETRQTSAGPGLGDRGATNRTSREGIAGDEPFDGDRTGDFEVTAHALGERIVGLDRRVDQRARQLLGPLEAFGRCPIASNEMGPAIRDQRVEPLLPLGYRPCEDEGKEEIVELVRVPGFGTDLFEDLCRGGFVERRELTGSDR